MRDPISPRNNENNENNNNNNNLINNNNSNLINNNNNNLINNNNNNNINNNNNNNVSMTLIPIPDGDFDKHFDEIKLHLTLRRLGCGIYPTLIEEQKNYLT